VISKKIKNQIRRGEILICDFVDGGQCFAELYKMEKSDRPIKNVKFYLTKEVWKEFGKIAKIECVLVREEKGRIGENHFNSNVCPEDKYKLSFKNDKKVYQSNC
jgi:hypothetical protein